MTPLRKAVVDNYMDILHKLTRGYREDLKYILDLIVVENYPVKNKELLQEILAK